LNNLIGLIQILYFSELTMIEIKFW